MDTKEVAPSNYLLHGSMIEKVEFLFFSSCVRVSTENAIFCYVKITKLWKKITYFH